MTINEAVDTYQKMIEMLKWCEEEERRYKEWKEKKDEKELDQTVKHLK